VIVASRGVGCGGGVGVGGDPLPMPNKVSRKPLVTHIPDRHIAFHPHHPPTHHRRSQMSVAKRKRKESAPAAAATTPTAAAVADVESAEHPSTDGDTKMTTVDSATRTVKTATGIAVTAVLSDLPMSVNVWEHNMMSRYLIRPLLFAPTNLKLRDLENMANGKGTKEQYKYFKELIDELHRTKQIEMLCDNYNTILTGGYILINLDHAKYSLA